MSSKKIFLLVPDGVGLRNFAYTNFYKLAQSKGHEVVIWHCTPFDVSAMGFRCIKMPQPSTHWLTSVLKVLRIRFDLAINQKRDNDNIYACYLFKSPIKNARDFIRNLLVEAAVLFLKPAEGLRLVRKLIKHKESSTPYYRACLATLQQEKPAIVFCTNQRIVYAIAPILAAQSLGIPTATFIFSWDNLPKATMALEPDYYFVWSKHMAEELTYYHPYINEEQIFVTGTPQFEPHTYAYLMEDRAVFFAKHGLDVNRRYICFSGDDVTTSPYDHQYLNDLAAAIRKRNSQHLDQLGIIFRRCPVDFSDRYDRVLEAYKDIIIPLNPRWERVGDTWNAMLPTQDDLALQVNTIAHTDAVVNLGSSMVFDYAAFNKPCIFVAYEGGPTSPTRSVETIYRYIHFRSMPNKEAVLWVYQPTDFANMLDQALSQPDLTLRYARDWFKKVAAHPISAASENVLMAIENITCKHEANS